MTSNGCSSSMPCSCMVRATSMPASTPMMPSKRPPAMTVSQCEPVAMGLRAGLRPARVPIRLPPASSRVARPAASNSLRSQARASLNSGEKARRVQGKSGKVKRDRVSTRAQRRSASRGGKGCEGVGEGESEAGGVACGMKIPEDALEIMSWRASASRRMAQSASSGFQRIKRPAARTVRAFPGKPRPLHGPHPCCGKPRCVLRCLRSTRR
ncbi:hypothetical protein LMG3431_05904 [Achromobacter pestifer]|uniref:Uncharacterized protein n=1 Tax=Achromobacter pestifer TaxID=1353889 RepID=A0A6S7AYS4_9BURK|nr:hypothetical protein LMG3431_05904 [Achromobacter pestifer]